jgi:hypothetical protein
VGWYTREIFSSVGVFQAMPDTRIRDAKYWLDRAAEARALAAEMRDQTPHRMTLSVAECYELLAKSAEPRTGRPESGP